MNKLLLASLLVISFSVFADKDLKCETLVLSVDGQPVTEIARCENEELVCYLKKLSYGMECNFKEKGEEDS